MLMAFLFILVGRGAIYRISETKTALPNFSFKIKLLL